MPLQAPLWSSPPHASRRRSSKPPHCVEPRQDSRPGAKGLSDLTPRALQVGTARGTTVPHIVTPGGRAPLRLRLGRFLKGATAPRTRGKTERLAGEDRQQVSHQDPGVPKRLMGNSPGAFQIRGTTSMPGGSKDPRRSSVFSVRLRSFLRFGLALFMTETSTEMDPLSLEQSDKSSTERDREPSLCNPLARAFRCGTR
jgi:hypothetical protein